MRDKTTIMDLIIEELYVFRLTGVSVTTGIILFYMDQNKILIYMIYMVQAWKKNDNT